MNLLDEVIDKHVLAQIGELICSTLRMKIGGELDHHRMHLGKALPYESVVTFVELGLSELATVTIQELCDRAYTGLLKVANGRKILTSPIASTYDKFAFNEARIGWHILVFVSPVA